MAGNKKTVAEKSRKLVIVGDGGCGKTSLLYAFTQDVFDSNYAPTIFDTHATEIQVDNKRVRRILEVFSSRNFGAFIDNLGTV